MNGVLALEGRRAGGEETQVHAGHEEEEEEEMPDVAQLGATFPGGLKVSGDEEGTPVIDTFHPYDGLCSVGDPGRDPVRNQHEQPLVVVNRHAQVRAFARHETAFFEQAAARSSPSRPGSRGCK